MTCFFRNERAGMTPGVCIIIACIMTLNFLMLDAARVYSIRNIAARKQKLAASSLLANFYGTLQEDYGLYAVYGGDKTESENDFYSMISSDGTENFLLSADEDYPELKLMDYSVSKSEVAFKDHLGDVDNLKNQICQIMKYDSASNVLVKIASQISALTDLSSMAGAYGKYMEVTSLYDSYRASVKNISVTIDGAFENSTQCVNGILAFPEHNSSLFSANLKKLVLSDSTAYSKEAAEALKMALSMHVGQLLMLLTFNEDAARLCDELLVYINDSNSKLSDIETWMLENPAEEDYEEDFFESMQEMIDEIRNTYSNASIGALKSAVLRNKELIESVKFQWAELEKKIVAGATVLSSDIYEFTDDVDAAYSSYKTVWNPSSGDGNSETGDYSKYLLKTEADSAIENFLTEKVTIPEELYDTLPSVQKSKEFSYSLSSLSDCKNLDGKESITELLADCATVGSLLEAGLNEALEIYFVDDYIADRFTTAASVKKAHNRYMQGEIEYIIAGTGSEKTNIEDVYVKLFGIRTGMNVIHVVCDAEKMSIARKAGAALAAASAGIGASLYTALVITGWAVAEAAVDITDLEKGLTVPLIKKKGDWHTSLSGEAMGLPSFGGSDDGADITDSDDLFAMGYEEYLRLLLLQIPTEVKLRRVQDIIELNLYKESNTRLKLSEFYTVVECSGEYIMNTFVLHGVAGEKKYVFKKECQACM